MKKFITVLLITINLSITSQANNEFRLVHKEDAKMKAAFKKAKSTLHNFLNLVNKGEDKNSIYGAYIKVEDGGETEFLWVTDVKKHNKDFYIGHVISTPMLIHSIKKGDTIGYKTSDIFDWQRYDKEQKITFGAFTICALINQKSKEDREYINKNGMHCSQ